MFASTTIWKTHSSNTVFVGDDYTIADAAFTPYINRLTISTSWACWKITPRVLNWYRRLQERQASTRAITRWENEKYLTLMRASERKAGRRFRASCALPDFTTPPQRRKRVDVGDNVDHHRICWPQALARARPETRCPHSRR
jgi:hypothetical protein